MGDSSSSKVTAPSLLLPAAAATCPPAAAPLGASTEKQAPGPKSTSLHQGGASSSKGKIYEAKGEWKRGMGWEGDVTCHPWRQRAPAQAAADPTGGSTQQAAFKHKEKEGPSCKSNDDGKRKRRSTRKSVGLSSTEKR